MLLMNCTNVLKVFRDGYIVVVEENKDVTAGLSDTTQPRRREAKVFLTNMSGSRVP
jgi:hypothetical protein